MAECHIRGVRPIRSSFAGASAACRGESRTGRTARQHAQSHLHTVGRDVSRQRRAGWLHAAGGIQQFAARTDGSRSCSASWADTARRGNRVVSPEPGSGGQVAQAAQGRWQADPAWNLARDVLHPRRRRFMSGYKRPISGYERGPTSNSAPLLPAADTATPSEETSEERRKNVRGTSGKILAAVRRNPCSAGCGNKAGRGCDLRRRKSDGNGCAEVLIGY